MNSLIDAEQPQDTTRTSFGWERYNNLTEIYAWLDDLVIEFSNVLTNYDFGKSYENRTLRAVKLSYKEVTLAKTVRFFSIDFVEMYPIISTFFTGKSNDFHWVKYSCTRMGHICNVHVYFEWILNISRRGCSRFGGELRLGIRTSF